MTKYRSLVIEVDYEDRVLKAYAVFWDRWGHVVFPTFVLDLKEAGVTMPSQALAELIVWAWPPDEHEPY